MACDYIELNVVLRLVCAPVQSTDLKLNSKAKTDLLPWLAAPLVISTNSHQCRGARSSASAGPSLRRDVLHAVEPTAVRPQGADDIELFAGAYW